MCIAAIPKTPSSASASSISTKGCRSGATVTSRWSSGRLAQRQEPVGQPARRICAKQSALQSSRIYGRSDRNCNVRPKEETTYRRSIQSNKRKGVVCVHRDYELIRAGVVTHRGGIRNIVRDEFRGTSGTNP